MPTVFSHIIQKRYSQSFEDVATDALAYILSSYDQARVGMMRTLRGIEPGLPDLTFRTQQTEGSTRPDMCGYAGLEKRVYVENKFWAGLTDNQPVAYLRRLADYEQPTLLLAVVPGAREQTMISELARRLKEADIPVVEQDARVPGVVWQAMTGMGPWLALTSWQRLLEMLEDAVQDDRMASSDLLQLRSLCQAADIDAFVHMSAEDITNQRVPALILQLGGIVRASVDNAVRRGILSIEGLHEVSALQRFGRYAWLQEKDRAGIWFGYDLELWKTHGRSPLWVRFSTTSFGRAHEVEPLLRAWSTERGRLVKLQDGSLACAIDVETGVDQDQVIAGIVGQLKEMADILALIGVSASASGQ